MAASVPDETRRTFSTEGTASTISAASSTSASVGAPKLVPRSAAARTAAGNAEAGDDLVEHEQRSRSVGEEAQRFEKARLGRDDPHVSGNGLDDDRGEALAVLGHG